MAAVQRECAMHEGIDGTWHRYGHLHWWSPDGLYDSKYERPECPVAQLASVDSSASCTQIAKRITDEEGRGAWYCGWHGVFRVYEYPDETTPKTRQSTLAGIETDRHEEAVRS